MDKPNLQTPEIQVEIQEQETQTPTREQPLPEKQVLGPTQSPEQILPVPPVPVQESHQKTVNEAPVPAVASNHEDQTKGMGNILDKKGPTTAAEAAQMAEEVEKLQSL